MGIFGNLFSRKSNVVQRIAVRGAPDRPLTHSFEDNHVEKLIHDVHHLIPEGSKFLASDTFGCEGRFVRFLDGKEWFQVAGLFQEDAVWVYPMSLDQEWCICYVDVETPEGEHNRVKVRDSCRVDPLGVFISRTEPDRFKVDFYEVPQCQIVHNKEGPLSMKVRPMYEGVTAWSNDVWIYTEIPQALLGSALLATPHRLKQEGYIGFQAPSRGIVFVWSLAELGGSPGPEWELVGNMNAEYAGNLQQMVVFSLFLSERPFSFLLPIGERFVGGFSFKFAEVEGSVQESNETPSQTDSVDHPHAVGDFIDDPTLDDEEELRRILQSVHPALKFPDNTTGPDAAFNEHARALMNPARHYNAKFIHAVERNRVFSDIQGSQVIPDWFLVTGHKGVGGNLGINGLYQRYPNSHDGRPVYQKKIEKGVNGQAALPADKTHIKFPHDTAKQHPANYLEFFEIASSKAAKKVEAPRVVPEAHQQIQASRGVYFLYYLNSIGSWCIGPKVGSQQCFAKHNCSDEEIPFMMGHWQMWDAGLHGYKPCKGLRVLKCGSVQSHNKASIPTWVPPIDMHAARLPGDRW